MTPNQLHLLKSMAHARVAELRMGVQSIEEALVNPNVPQPQKAVLAMQKGTLSAALEDLEETLAAVEQEDPAVLKG